ncbi:pyruvate carboxylase [Gamsiella multidivaricata]|uniref:pyruvate carboxylase n=1 Tax=Gamsiella multidivaricata TaxID=101098 RepID=UPI0022206A0C|nr:pyruvate carboxylase [Gamsiella multidivaricata]KAG0365147.1 pyruvate carboxylase [Gamsiella multidivaricata]KAI7823006.1 pyruvate carboxylase [Gamsiella multidivaricata]
MVHPEEHTVDTIRRSTTAHPDDVLKKILVANRGEIAIRVFRSAHELAMKTVALFSYEDRLSMHRYKADEAYQIGDPSKFTPVGAYLAQDEIIRIAKLHDVSMIHPGYGFLSENASFAKKCADNGIAFVGPAPHVIEALGDKTKARDIAIAAGVPVVPGTPGPISSVKDAETFVKQYGFPVIIKAAMGGGGRGMRVVRSQADFAEGFERATSEAKQAFGDGTVFIERFLDKPRHIEVQLLADEAGNVVHLFERDCSVQRRHQKVVEIAPAKSLTPSVRDAILNDAIKLAKHVKYKNAGTAEFLVDQQDRHYFIEINPRIQVEHTITEEITGIDIVAAQIQIAAGILLPELGLTQDKIQIRGFAIQCRVTTEDPAQNFQPDTGRIEVYRSAGGNGVRLDGGQGFVGAVITPHYDSLLVKVTCSAATYELARRKVVRALVEFRIRGVKTNIPFVQRLITHETFIQGKCWTTFIDDTPGLFNLVKQLNRAQKLLAYLGDVAVNGPSIAGQIGEPLLKKELLIPSLSSKEDSTQAVDVAVPPTTGWRKVFLEKGAEGFAKAVRAYPGVLITDTTWRDAHQSLLATRVRTIDLLNIAPTTAHALSNAYSLEMWGGATFDVAMRFLHEDPWDRLIQLRKLVPNIPFQMLFRGANAVGYTSYPDNVIFDFCAKAVQSGMDVFRIFDSLNYIDNMRLGIQAVKAAGGIVEAAVCYTGDVSDPKRTKHNLEYYLNFVQELVNEGIHILAIKDMAGLLKPTAATILVGAIRKRFPDLPIHMHTHDTAGTGVASMLAAAAAGADVIDLAVDIMSGVTSQPSMGAVVAALEHTEMGTGIRQEDVIAINSYWEQARLLYSGFEANVRAADSGVYQHEMPGGQYTNLMFQAQQLGLGTQWNEIKKAYIEANQLCGDIVKVTPSSKVVGDLAQFMVSNSLSGEEVKEKAASLNFPTSVVEFFQGYLGQPYGGFPEPLRTAIIRGMPRIEGRPGADMGEFDLAGLKQELMKKYGKTIRDVDVSSAAIYPKVFDEYRAKVEAYGDLSVLPTRYFLSKLEVGEEVNVEIEKGKTLIIKLLAVGPINASSGKRDVFFELNGEGRNVSVQDKNAAVEHTARERANPGSVGDIGAPMSGVVVEIRVKQGTVVKEGDPICILSAMKMETVVSAPCSGKVEYVPIKENDSLSSGDLVARIVHG